MDMFDFRARNYMVGEQKPKVDVPFRGMDIMPPKWPQQSQPQMEEPDDEFSVLEKLYNAPSPALEAYKRHIRTMPKMGDFQPSGRSRFLAALIGGAAGWGQAPGYGAQVGQNVLDRPYQQAMQQHQMEGQGLGELANIESNDFKNRIGMAKTMGDARRENTKLIQEAARNNKLNALTDAQIQQLNDRIATSGKSIQKNVADGQLYIVDLKNGDKQPLGKFDQTPAEKRNMEVDLHQKKSNIDLGEAKNLFGYKAPIEMGNQIAAHQQNRMFDAANPIPQAGFDSTAPSQNDIAFRNAVSETVLENPQWAKFVDENATSRQKGEFPNDPEYAKFKMAVEKRKAKTIGASKRTPISRGRPQVNLPEGDTSIPAPSSPLNAPNVSVTASPDRDRAIAQLKADGQPTTEEMINWLLNSGQLK